MNHSCLKPHYKKKPISSLTALSKCLGVDKQELLDVSAISDTFYSSNPPILKPDGSKRYTYRVDHRLMNIQKRINKYIFRNTYFPHYLQGSIRDTNSPRSAVSNAEIHKKAVIIISEDISNFFPSINSSLVLNMWKYLFNFPHEVALKLTQLTTYNGFVAQGAPTSSYIANLIFWDAEPNFIDYLQLHDMVYTRYVDDVTISSSNAIPKHIVTDICVKVRGLFAQKGFTINRKKHKIITRNQPFEIHGINLNAGRPTIGRKRKQEIRHELYKLNKLVQMKGKAHADTQSLYKSLNGKINFIKQISPALADRYSKSLSNIF